MKHCPSCEQDKPETEFHLRQKGKLGLCSHCKSCQRETKRSKRRGKIGYYATEQRNDNNGSKRNAKARKSWKQLVFDHYSEGVVKCARCPYNDVRALSIDHINNDGSSHRRLLEKLKVSFYRWLVVNNYPPGFQVLCMNCQFEKEADRRRAEKRVLIPVTS